MNKTTKPVNFIHFHGLTLLVVECDGVEYVPARPLCDLAGMDWKGARRSLFEPDNATLYGSAELEEPVFDALRGLKSPQKQVCIRLDRGRMFLARIHTSRMRANGNEAAADQLLALQVEWAEALHAYESHGIAVKKGKRDARAELVALIKARGTSPTAPERTALSNLIAEALAELGQDLPAEPQLSLPGVQA